MPDPRFFKNHGPFTVEQIAAHIGCNVQGDKSIEIKDIATLANAKEGEISFFSNPKYKSQFEQSKASACIVDEENAKYAPKGMTLLISSKPYVSYAMITGKFYSTAKREPYVAPTAAIAESAKVDPSCHIAANAVIGENVELGMGVYIGPNTTIDDGVTIDAMTQIRANVTVSHSKIGRGCIIHPGARIGQDGFGFAPHSSGITKVEQLGRVIIEDGVEIGSNTCVDRGAIEDTYISAGTKIDNLVQLGHNVRIGNACFIVSQVGISGSTKIGTGVMIGGQSGLTGHIEVGDGAMIAAGSGIMSNVEPKAILGGAPAMPIKQWLRQVAALKKLTKRKKEDKNAS